MDAFVTKVAWLSLLDADCIVARLTKPNSEFQQEVKSRQSHTPVCIVRTQAARVAAWTATHEWRGMQTLEGFTDEGLRRHGIARVAACMLVADGHVDPRRTTVVFSPAFVPIATSAGCRDVRLYERRGEDWIENS
jgi:hypothetical protein